jgi:hypothetical protein
MIYITLKSSVVDRHRFGADPDPDPTFHKDADPDPDPALSLIHAEKSDFLRLYTAMPVYIVLSFESVS